MLRATLRSMRSRKLRLLLSMIAVVLGAMSVSAAFVMTDMVSRSFENLFTNIYEYTDIEVNKTSGVPTMTGGPSIATLPASDVARVEAIDGVTKATGFVFTDGARPVGKNGKVIASLGPPRFGANWVGEIGAIGLREGRGPTADNEIAISANLVTLTGYTIGDSMQVITKEPKQAYTIVGITGYPGGRDSLAGETTIFFTEPVAQRVMLEETGVFNTIDVQVDDNAALGEVRDRIAAALGSDYRVQTGQDLADQSSNDFREAFSAFGYILLGFAAIALFVGAFLILNTFSITVAQRTRELALFRAMGSSRGQVIVSVLVEAAIIGAISSVIGLVVGIGIGAAAGLGLGSFITGGEMELAGLAVPPTAIIGAFAVGIGVTVISAIVPALRASRVAPVEAMREATIPDKPLTRLTLAGAAVLAVGGTVLGLGLAGKLGDAGLWSVLGGVLVCFVGVALLTPLVARPVVEVLGRAFGRRSSARLGRANSARNPRRTAITAAALMVSVALVTAISVVVGSLQASTEEVVTKGVTADLYIGANLSFGGTFTPIDAATLDRIRELPDSVATVGIGADLMKVNGTDEFVSGLDDVAAALPMFSVEPTAGTLSPLPSGRLIIDDRSATDRKLSVGSTLTVETATAGSRTFTVAGIYKRTALIAGFVFGPEDFTTLFTLPAPVQAYVDVREGGDVSAVRTQIDAILKDSPESISVATMDELVAQQAQIFTIVIGLVQLLLALAMFIAVLGILNTLLLSTVERTRELGLLRAVGMKRGQVMWMVTVESVVISVFGALLGIAVGAGLGTAVFQALRSEGFTTLAFPWGLMVVYVFASAIVGLVAGLIPAIVAARLDVLKAIAYE